MHTDGNRQFGQQADGESIPKIIHYCWFGGKPLGELEQKCIASWRRFLPGYEIKCWDESNYDVHGNGYVENAFAQSKWAFLSDYVRFDVLNRFGGVYFDTDVELIKPMDDILAAGPFVACEADGPGDPKMRMAKAKRVNSGCGMAMSPGHYLCRMVLALYGSLGSDPKTSGNVMPITADLVTPILVDSGLVDGSDVQRVAQLTVYPTEYFNPKSYETGEISLTENTRAIHHFAMTWHNKREAFEYGLRKRLLQRGMSYGAASVVSTAAEILRFADIARVIRKLR